MRKIERIKKNIENDKEIMKSINKESCYSIDTLISDIQTYIKAVKSGRILYSVESVSRSGMTRQIKVLSCEKSGKGCRTRHYYRQYITMFKVLGYSIKRGWSGTVRVFGCGMNMLFHVNYCLMHKFCRLSFISKKQCAVLAQQVN